MAHLRRSVSGTATGLQYWCPKRDRTIPLGHMDSGDGVCLLSIDRCDVEEWKRDAHFFGNVL